MTYHVFMGRSCVNARRPLASLDSALDYVGRIVAARRASGLARHETFTIVADGHAVRTITA